MFAFAALATEILNLEKIADFLDDHPGVELYYRNYRKLPLARAHLRKIRSVVRDVRLQGLSRQQSNAAIEVGQAAESLLQRIPQIEKLDFRAQIQDLAEKVFQLIPSNELPQLPPLPNRTPKWIREQIQRDYQEISKCYSAGANRACIAFSARILECVLGYRFHKKVGTDPVQAGWPFGKLVAESKTQNILNDVVTPGLGHLLQFLNSTRIATVHVKPKVYEPSADDTKTIVQIALSLIVPLLP